MSSNRLKVERSSWGPRVQGGAHRFSICVVLVVAGSLAGCDGKSSQTNSQTSTSTVPKPNPVTQPAPAAPTVTDLKGIWVGSMPPSRDGHTVLSVPESSDLAAALLTIETSDVHGSNGKLTLCSMHKTADVGSFSNAQIGKSAVLLSGTKSAISFVNLSGDGASLTVGLRSDESAFYAGVLHRGTEAEFKVHCKI